MAPKTIFFKFSCDVNFFLPYSLTTIAGLHRVHDELFKCEQNSKMAVKRTGKLFLLKLCRVGNVSIVYLTRDSISIDTKIVGLPLYFAYRLVFMIYVNSKMADKMVTKHGGHTNFVSIFQIFANSSPDP